jgi:hypothetical protein
VGTKQRGHPIFPGAELGLRADVTGEAETHRDSSRKKAGTTCGWHGELGAPPRGAGSLHRAG